MDFKQQMEEYHHQETKEGMMKVFRNSTPMSLETACRGLMFGMLPPWPTLEMEANGSVRIVLRQHLALVLLPMSQKRRLPNETWPLGEIPVMPLVLPNTDSKWWHLPRKNQNPKENVRVILQRLALLLED
jgi:hypothetical protein